jgi:hypothetical protein
MNASQSMVSAGISASCTTLNGGSLVFMSGTMPASPETALSGNTTFTDGTAVWTYVGSGELFDVVISNPVIQLAVPISLSQTMKMPAV